MSPLDESLQESLPAAGGRNADEHGELYRAIGQLEALDRLIIMLVLEEVEYDEISKITGINPINLRVKIHRIKKKMKTYLKTEFSNG